MIRQKRHILAALLMLALLLPLAGCTTTPTPGVSPEQQKLDNARNVFDVGKRVMYVLIATGYVAKDDPATQKLIGQLAVKADGLFDKAQAVLTAGNKLDYSFWFDQAMTAFDEFMKYKMEGERKHRLSNPTTRPALPGKGQTG